MGKLISDSRASAECFDEKTADDRPDGLSAVRMRLRFFTWLRGVRGGQVKRARTCSSLDY